MLSIGLSSFAQAESAKRVARIATVANNKLRKHGCWPWVEHWIINYVACKPVMI